MESLAMIAVYSIVCFVLVVAASVLHKPFLALLEAASNIENPFLRAIAGWSIFLGPIALYAYVAR